MPFKVYKNLTDDDLKAMFAYLRTLKPVKHRVDNAVTDAVQAMQAETWRRCRELEGTVRSRA